MCQINNLRDSFESDKKRLDQKGVKSNKKRLDQKGVQGNKKRIYQ
jgi:hypothetical protein